MTEKITKGMNIAYLSKVKESMTAVQAIEEYVDNMIQKNAKEINLNIDNENNVIEIVGNGGNVMSYESMVNYAEKYIYHNVSESDKNKISLKGVGSKDAAICLANYEEKGYGQLVFMSGKIGDKLSKLVWTICLDEDVLSQKQIDIVDNDINLNGSLVRIVNSIDISGHVVKFIKEDFAKIYSRFIADGLKLVVNGEEIKSFDPMYFNLLSTNVDKEGLHNTMEGMMYHIVKNKTFHNVTYPSIKFDVKLTMVGFTPAAMAKGITNKLDEGGTKSNGVYVNIGGRYVEHGGNMDNMINRAGTGGGTGRRRMCLDIDSVGAEIFGITSNKGKGVPPFIRNEKLMFEFVDEYGNTLVKLLQHYNLFGANVYRLESLSTKKYAEVSFDKISHLFDEFSKIKCINLKDTSKDDVYDIKKGKKGKVKASKKPSVEKIKKVSSVDIIEVNKEEDLTEFYVTQKKKLEFLKTFKDGVFTRDHLIIISNALKANNISPKRMQYILNDIVEKSRELEKAVVTETVFTK